MQTRCRRSGSGLSPRSANDCRESELGNLGDPIVGKKFSQIIGKSLSSIRELKQATEPRLVESAENPAPQ